MKISNSDKISVIIPIYNVEKYVKKCIESVIAQTYSNLEIILVDDGSTDNCGEICDEYARRDVRIKVIHKMNGGLSDARNAGLDMAVGEYIAYVDGDDYVSNDYIEVLYKILVLNNADISIGSFQYIFGGDTEKDDKPQKTNVLAGSVLQWTSEETLHHMLQQRKITTSVCGVLSRSIYWERVRFPKGKICEDLGTSYKIYSQAEKIVFTNQVIYYYLMRQGSIQNTKFSKEKMDELALALECQTFINNNYPDLESAAANRVVSSAFHILFSMKDDSEAFEESQELKRIIQSYRKQMIFGKDVNKKVRLGCMCTYFGYGFAKWLYQKLGMRGRINL